MANFVFCAGGGVGGWCWRDMKIDAKLRGAGHEVFMPTYTGVGERVHLSNPKINLNTHIQDILMHLKYEDLTDVILVGYSAQAHGGGWLLVPVWPDADPRDTTHPLATAYTPVVIDNPKAAKIPRTYIFCTEGKEDDPTVRFTVKQIEKVKADPQWDYREIKTDHAVREIDELLKILLEIGTIT